MSITNIKCWQVNLHHCQAASYNICREIDKVHIKNSTLVLIQEPWIYKSKIRGLGRNNIFQGTGNPRACIVASAELTAWKLNDYCDADIVAVAIRGRIGPNNHRRIVFASVYMAHGLPVPPVKMEELVRYCEDKRLPLIIGSDVNAHHQLWGSTDTNARGDDLFNYLATTTLSWANKGHKPTFVTRNRQEVLDVTFFSDEASGLIDDWHVSDEPSLSDHKYIKFQISLDKPKPPLRRWVKNTDWDVYRCQLRGKIEELQTTEPINSPEAMEMAANSITSCMVSAWEEACPITRGQKSTSKTWWTPELSRERTKVRSLLRRACRSTSDESWDNYHVALRNYKYSLRKTKRKSWQDYCNKTESLDATVKLCKFIRNDDHCKLGSIEKSDGGYTSSPEETLKVLAETHILTNHGPYNMDHFGGEPASEVLTGKIVQKRRAKLAVYRCEPYKAPGMDGIYPAMMQHGWDYLRQRMMALFRASISLGRIPGCWGTARGVFLPKPGKDSYTKAKAFRMITLTSYQLKVLERLVLWYLLKEEGIDSKLHKFQYGFRGGRSTEAALHQLIHRIEETFVKGDLSMGVFLDIEGAFDKVPFATIEAAAFDKGIHKDVIRWITYMLHNREITITLDEACITEKITAGCPQGGILSPLLWNLVIDDLLDMWNDKHSHMQAYADDVTVLHTSRHLDDLYSQAQETLNEVEAWAEDRGLKFSHTKTEIVIFSNKRRLATDQYQLTFYGNPMDIGKSVKYLGIIIDTKLSWKNHINMIWKKANSIIMQCKRIIGVTWGVNPRQVKWIYTSIVRPILSYGCVVWINALSIKQNCTKLEKVQRLAIKLMTGAYPGTPLSAMEAALDLPPLDIFLKGEALKAAYRLQRDDHWNKITNRNRGRVLSHTVICERLQQEIPSLGMPGDAQTPELVWDLPCEIEIQDRVAAIDTALNGTPQEVVCFTDGSVMGGRAGAGIVFFGGEVDGRTSLPLGEWPTIFQAEIYALTEAALQLNQTKMENMTIRFLTDSQAAIKALSQAKIKQKTVKRCYQEISILNSKNRVELQWVPGHVNVPGNEIADREAKHGAETEIMGPEPVLPVTLSLCKNAIDRWVQTQHQERWQNLRTCREARKTIPTINQKLGEKLLGLTRMEVRQILQILTGHGNVGKYNYLTGRSNTNICQKCEEEMETAEHYVCRCPAYMHERIRFFNHFEVDISTATNVGNIDALIGFLRRSGRLLEY